MKLDGFEIKAKLFESIIGSVADTVAGYIVEEYTFEAQDRAGVDEQSLARRFQADAVFRQLLETEAQEIVQTILNDINDDYDLSSTLYAELTENLNNHWVQDVLANLDKCQQDLELEESIREDVETEKSIMEALKVLEAHGIQFEQQDTELHKAMKIAQQAGYRIVVND